MSFRWNNVNRAVERITQAALVIPVLLGLAVLVAWHLHLDAVIQVRSSYIAMAYNTALAFVIAGLGMWASQKCQRAVAFSCAGFLSILGSLVFVEHVFGINFGVDELLMVAYNTVGTTKPGRMAPNTAIGFLLIGAAIALTCANQKRRLHLIGLGLLGALVVAIGSIPFVGYLLGIATAYTWSPTANQMAVHTAVGFMSLGVAVLAIAWTRSQEVEAGPPEWFPWLAGIGGLAMTLLLWQALVAHDRQEINGSIVDAQQASEARVLGTLRAYISPLERMSPVWEPRTKSAEEWEQKGARWLDPPPGGGFAAILSASPNRELWVSSNQDLDYQPLLKDAAAVSWDSSTITSDWATHVRLIRAGPMVGVVIRSQYTRGAFLLGILRFGQTMEIQMNHGLSRSYNVLLTDGTNVLYERNSRDRANWSGVADKPFVYLGVHWKLSVWPSSNGTKSQASVLPGLSLGVGIIVSLLLAFAMWLVRNSHFRALQLEAAQGELRIAHDGLERKIQERTEELARTNLELSQTAQQYRFMADAMPQIVWTAKSNGDTDYYNQRWYDYTGLSFEQTKDWGWQVVVHPDDLQNCLEHWITSLNTGAPYEVAYRFKGAYDGLYRWHLGRARAMHNESGEIIKWFGTCTDIEDYKQAESELLLGRSQLELRVQERTADLTIANASLQAEIAERQLVEQQLRDQREHFRLTLETANDAFVCIDDTGSIVEWNRQAQATFGWSKQEAIGQELSGLIIPPEYRDAHRRGMARYMNSGQASVLNQTIQLPALHRNGNLIPVEVTIWPVRDGGKIRFNAFLRDITGRKQMEEDLRQNNLRLKEKNRQVEEASRMKTAFLANMSHELRTPLNGILGFTELMIDGLIGPVSHDQKECLEEVLTSSRHLLALINDVLDVAKVESGTLIFRPECIVVSDLVSQAVSGLRPLALQKSVHLDISVDPAVDHVQLDPQKLKQILLNYLSNALKFTPAHGTIRVFVRPEEGQFFRLEVEDSGIGIAEEDIGRLFQEFQQLDGGASKLFQGTGLGLALTKRLVEAQGGQVGVRSTVGEGSTFFAILPVGQPIVCPEIEQGVLRGQ